VDGIVAARLRVFSRESGVSLFLTGGQTPWPAQRPLQSVKSALFPGGGGG
jgi:hypothetical protein